MPVRFLEMGERFPVGSNVQTFGEHLNDLLLLLRDKARALRQLRTWLARWRLAAAR